MYTQPLVGFDLETTGVDVHDVENTRVVTCSMIFQASSDTEPKIKNWLLDPEIQIPTQASDIHGITTEHAREFGSNYQQGLQEIATTLEYAVVHQIPTCAYNGSFDISLLRNQFTHFSIEIPENLWDNVVMFDPLVMDKYIDRYRKGKRTLSVVSSLYDYDLQGAHEASADVLATMHVTRRIVPKFVDKVEKDYGQTVSDFSDIMSVQKVLYKEQAEGLESYFRKTKDDPTITINKSWPFQDKENN